MNRKPTSVCDKTQTRRGITLVEVILAAAMLAILAVVATTALFIPRLLVVNSGLEQSAIHAGTAEIERHLDNYGTPTPADRGQFNTDGWALDAGKFTTPLPIIRQDNQDLNGNPLFATTEYVELSTAVEYRDGKTIDLVTYRSQEVSGSER